VLTADALGPGTGNASGTGSWTPQEPAQRPEAGFRRTRTVPSPGGPLPGILPSALESALHSISPRWSGSPSGRNGIQQRNVLLLDSRRGLNSGMVENRLFVAGNDRMGLSPARVCLPPPSLDPLGPMVTPAAILHRPGRGTSGTVEGPTTDRPGSNRITGATARKRTRKRSPNSESTIP
jgi:hypothetical protein